MLSNLIQLRTKHTFLISRNVIQKGIFACKTISYAKFVESHIQLDDSFCHQKLILQRDYGLMI